MKHSNLKKPKNNFAVISQIILRIFAENNDLFLRRNTINHYFKRTYILGKKESADSI